MVYVGLYLLHKITALENMLSSGHFFLLNEYERNESDSLLCLHSIGIDVILLHYVVRI